MKLETDRAAENYSLANILYFGYNCYLEYRKCKVMQYLPYENNVEIAVYERSSVH